MSDTLYTLDELKRRFEELGLDHIVTEIEFNEYSIETMNVKINLQLINKPESLDTSEERFNRAMKILDAK